jgi:hypothetical protein
MLNQEATNKKVSLSVSSLEHIIPLSCRVLLRPTIFFILRSMNSVQVETLRVLFLQTS